MGRPARTINENNGSGGCRVDLVNRAAIEQSRNYIRRKAILESARVVYAA